MNWTPTYVLFIFGWPPNLRLEIPFPNGLVSHAHLSGGPQNKRWGNTKSPKKKTQLNLSRNLWNLLTLRVPQIFDGILPYSMREQKRTKKPRQIHTNPSNGGSCSAPTCIIRKLTVAPDKWWLEDHLLFRNGPFSGDMAIFGGKTSILRPHSFFLVPSCSSRSSLRLKGWKGSFTYQGIGFQSQFTNSYDWKTSLHFDTSYCKLVNSLHHSPASWSISLYQILKISTSMFCTVENVRNHQWWSKLVC